MNDGINFNETNPKKNEHLSNVKDNVFDKTSISATKEIIIDNMTEWSIVHFETDVEEDVESFNDLIPSSWITNSETLSWYPMNEHQATVQKLVKQCTKPYLDWNCFSIKKIEGNIGKFYEIIFRLSSHILHVLPVMV